MEKKIIHELIKHMNRTDSNLNELKDKIAELRDLQLVNKLDIINLRNDIERLKLSIPVVSPETAEMLHRMEDIVKKAKDIEKLKSIAKEVENIEREIKKIKQASKRPLSERILGALEKRIDENKRKIDGIRSGIEKTTKKCPKCGAILGRNAKFCGKCGKKIK